MEPSTRLRLGRLAIALTALAAFSAAPAQAGSLHVVFPQSAEVIVVQGSTSAFSIDLSAYGATSCSATTAPVRIDTLYSVDAVGEIASGMPADAPITTAANRGSSDNCYIQTPVVVPLTVTAAQSTPVGDYHGLIRYGKGGDGGVDLDGPPLTVHVVAPPAQPVALPPAVVAPPQILVLGVRQAAPRPRFGATELITRVKGNVRFRIPGGASAALTAATIVPNGTVVDTTHGVAKVTVERTAGGVLDSADAWGGAFHMAQNAGTTTFTLTGADASAGRLARAARAAARRSLWVNGKGNFRTRGKRASAIVRGTFWHTEETAAGTKVTVRRGLVAVRDFARHTTVLVSRGHSYTAKPRTARARRVPAFTGSA